MSVKPARRASAAAVVTSIIVAIAALRLGRELLIPFALSILISFLLAPLVIWLQRFVGRMLAVISVTAVSLMFVVTIGWLVVDQVGELARKLPERREAITQKIRTLRESLRSELGRASETVEEISKEISGEPEDDPAVDVAIGPPAERPVPEVKVVQSEKPASTSAGSSFWAWVTTVFSPLAEAAIVVVLVVFMLVYYDDLRDRILRLVGTGRLNETTQAINDAAARVSRYLMAQTLINASHGTVVAIGLYFLGVPSALFFGLNSALLRFIPYVGPVLAAAMPIALTVAVSDGWATPMYVLSFFIILELLSNNVFEPWLYGCSTGLSPVAVIVAAVFWSWLWGPIGLVLSAPLTVCLVVLGKHVHQMSFLNILLSDQPVLEPRDRFYQRLLVMDQESAYDVAESFLKDHSLAEVYDRVILPALALSESDRHHGAHEEGRVEAILRHTRDIVEQLEEASQASSGEEAARESSAAETRKPARTAPAESDAVKIVCIPARDEADELAATMFVHLLRREGLSASCLRVETLAAERVDWIEQEQPDIVCISALPPMGITHARYMYKRIRTRFEDLIVLAGLWTTAGDAFKALNRTGQDERLRGVTSLIGGRDVVNQLAQQIALRKSGKSRRAVDMVASQA